MISLDSAWRLYIATRMHFLSGFNAKKYGTAYRNKKQIDSRPDKVLAKALIEGITNERQFVELCISNFLYEEDSFLYTNIGQKNHSKWDSYWDNPIKNFENDMSFVEMRIYQKECSFEEYMKTFAIDDILSSKLRRETLCILQFLMSDVILFLDGFGKERIQARITKTIPLIEGRLNRIKDKIHLTNYKFIQDANKETH